MPLKPPTKRRSPMEHPRHQYPQETAALQDIARSCGLTEKIKWGKPCFTLTPDTPQKADRNIVLIQRFNDYIALLFFQGAQLTDPERKLHRIGEHTQVARQLRFRSLAEVTAELPTIRKLIKEAIALEKSRTESAAANPTPKPPRKPPTTPTFPEELRTALAVNPKLKAAFNALTPGRQKGYVLHIAAAKQSATRTARIDKYTPAILTGKGMHD